VTRLFAALLLAIPLAGCCGGPDYALLAYNSRIELETRHDFATIATVSSDARAWAYGDPASALAPHAAAYRPRTAANVDTILPPADAPKAIATALSALRNVGKTLGYSPTKQDSADAAFVLSVALSWYDDGSLARVAVNVGAEIDGTFDPHAVSVAATLPEHEPCDVSVSELVESLASLLPPREVEEDAP
jgi:hypothetical protein